MLRSGRQLRLLRLERGGGMRLLKEGSEGKDVQIWRSYRTELLRFVLKRVRDVPLAEDIVHDVLLKAFMHRNGLKDGTRLRPWLFQITRNALVDHYRSHKPLEPLPEDLVGDSPEVPRAEQELARCLGPLLRELPQQYRRALTLADVDGLTSQTIAQREGLSVSGAKSRVQRARRMLRESVLRCCRIEMGKGGSVADYQPTERCDCGDPASTIVSVESQSPSR